MDGLFASLQQLLEDLLLKFCADVQDAKSTNPLDDFINPSHAVSPREKYLLSGETSEM